MTLKGFGRLGASNTSIPDGEEGGGGGGMVVVYLTEGFKRGPTNRNFTPQVEGSIYYCRSKVGSRCLFDNLRNL